MRTRSLLIAVVVCMLALGAAPTAGANEAENALVNICNVRGTPNPDVFPGVFFCKRCAKLPAVRSGCSGAARPEARCLSSGGDAASSPSVGVVGNPRVDGERDISALPLTL
jgi:hypothetical protein